MAFEARQLHGSWGCLLGCSAGRMYERDTLRGPTGGIKTHRHHPGIVQVGVPQHLRGRTCCWAEFTWLRSSSRNEEKEASDVSLTQRVVPGPSNGIYPPKKSSFVVVQVRVLSISGPPMTMMVHRPSRHAKITLPLNKRPFCLFYFRGIRQAVGSFVRAVILHSSSGMSLAL